MTSPVSCRRLVRDISEDTTRNVSDVSMGEERRQEVLRKKEIPIIYNFRFGEI